MQKQKSIESLKKLISEENRVFEAMGVGGTKICLYNLMQEAGVIVLQSTMYPTCMTNFLVFKEPILALKEALKAIDDECWNPEKASMTKQEYTAKGRTLLQQLSQP